MIRFWNNHDIRQLLAPNTTHGEENPNKTTDTSTQTGQSEGPINPTQEKELTKSSSAVQPQSAMNTSANQKKTPGYAQPRSKSNNQVHVEQQQKRKPFKVTHVSS